MLRSCFPSNSASVARINAGNSRTHTPRRAVAAPENNASGQEPGPDPGKTELVFNRGGIERGDEVNRGGDVDPSPTVLMKNAL